MKLKRYRSAGVRVACGCLLFHHYLLVAMAAEPSATAPLGSPSTLRAPASEANPSIEPIPAGSDALSPEIRRIQQALGGPTVNQFPLLQQNAKPGDSASRPGEQRQAIDALREAAAQIDQSANRLERYELYRQADALRQQAQQLRLDARSLGGSSDSTATARGAIRPWEWGNAESTRPAEIPRAARPDNQQNPPVPTLQPSPSPE